MKDYDGCDCLRARSMSIKVTTVLHNPEPTATFPRQSPHTPKEQKEIIKLTPTGERPERPEKQEMTGAHLMKRIPLIKFPPRHLNPSGSASQSEAASAGGVHSTFFSRSGVPGAPTNTSVGGKASDQPKRTPVSDREIEAILLGGCF